MEWPKIEQNVNEAEKAERKSLKASRVLYSETGISKNEREEMLDENIAQKSKRKRVAEKALEREKIFEREASEMLGRESSPERALADFRMKELAKAIRYNDSLIKQREHLLNEEAEILKNVNVTPGVEEQEALQEIREELEKNEKLKEGIMKISPEAYYGLHLKELKEYKKDLESGNFIETPSIGKIKEEVVESIKIGKYPVLHGHMGSGKTEFAKYVAREMTGKEALVFSGSKETSKAELMGHLALHKGQMPTTDEMIEIIEKETKSFDKKNPEMPPEERERKHSIIEKYVIEREKTGTETAFDFGYVYKAMKEGIPLIIDEWNMIPHSVMGRLNELLKKKPGDLVDVQEDGVAPFRVADGFFFVMTGNLNQGEEQYIERVDLDPAHLRRIHPIRYDYLPQYIEKKADDSISLEENAGSKNELFHLLISKVIDRNCNLELPKGSVGKLWNLAMGARITQDLFAGREVYNKFYPKLGGQTLRQPNFLKKFNIDLGRLDKILEAWAMRRDRDPDFYIWRYGIGEAVDEMDKATVFQLFKLNFGFFDGWESNEEDVLRKNARELVIVPKEKEMGRHETEFFGPRQVVEFCFGKAPERAQWPEIKSKEADETENSDKKAEEFMKKMMAEWEEWEKEGEEIEELKKLLAEMEENDKSNADEPKSSKSKKKKFRIF